MGAPCRATYSQDEKVYEAIISKVFENSGTCIVKFVGNTFDMIAFRSIAEEKLFQDYIRIIYV